MFEPHEQHTIRAWHDALDGERHLRILITSDPRSGHLTTFGETLGTLAPRVRVSLDREAAAGPPAIFVSSRLRYHAAPGGNELAPFLEAVQHRGLPPGPAAEAGAVAHNRLTTGVRVYVSPQCPHCPGATRELVRLLGQEPTMTLAVVDAGLFPDLAAGDGVRSVPTVIAGRHYRSAGTVWIEDVRAILSGNRLDAAALGRMLDAGDAEAVAAMMIEAGEVFPAVLDRLTHHAMAVRLGAMTAIERVVSAVPGAAPEAESGIWARVPHAGPHAAGDLLYLLGETGTSASLPRLAAWLEASTDDDLREAAADAMTRLAERA